jgi:hypothetical protein
VLRIRRTTSLSISTPKASVICWAIRLQPPVRLRRFISTTASINSFAGPFGPGGRTRVGENSSRYFCFVRSCENAAELMASARWRIAGSVPDASAKCTNRPRCDLRPEGWGHASEHDSESRLDVSSNGFGNDGTKSSGSNQPHCDDDCMQNKNENVAHVQDGTRLKKPNNSGRLRNSPPTRQRQSYSANSRNAASRRFTSSAVL